MLILTEQQKEAIQIISKKLKSGEKLITLAGFAGTGKSTIIDMLVQELGYADHVVFVTFTGKASQVLNNKGLPAQTIHRTIYKVIKNKWGGIKFIKKQSLDDEAIKLIIVDEVSMVSKDLLKDLISFKVPIIAIGDPGQLPPVGEDNGLLSRPDYFLTEIHRQAEDSEIITLSKMARNKELIRYGAGKDYLVIPKSDLDPQWLLDADQIICGYNNTRKTLNDTIRGLKGFDAKMPMKGDKLIQLANKWDFELDGQPILNGTIGYIADTPFQRAGINYQLKFNPDYTDNNINLTCRFQDPSSVKWDKSLDGICFVDYGYAITAHKSQGSEYGKIVIFEERLRSETHHLWLYTAITRAKNKIIIVK